MKETPNPSILWLLANNTTAPYFNWFAAEAARDGQLRMGFVCLYRERPQMVDDMAHFGFPVWHIPFDDRHRKRSMLRAAWQLYRLFRRVRPRVVHSHLFDDSLPAMLAARLAGVPMRVVTKGDTAFHWHYTPRWVWADRLINRLATHLVALSGESQRFILEQERAKPEKVHLIPHGLPVADMTRQDPARIEALRQRFGLDGRTVIGTVARFIHWKGHTDILEVAQRLVPTHTELLFLWTGSGPEEGALREAVAAAGLDRHVVFTGRIEPEDMPSLYGCMDIYLHVARYEPFGLVIAEAMLNGLPVVSTPTGASGDAIRHRENGWLAPYGDTTALAEGVGWVMANAGAGLGGRTEAESMFSISRMYADHKNLYNQGKEE